MLDGLAEGAVFSAVDASAGFWGCPMAEDSKQYTAFSTHSHGLLQFRRMPFGLLNASAEFQRIMTIVLAGTDCKAYIDDVVCQSKARTNHIDDPAVMLQRFELAGISLKLMKCL